MHLQLVAGYPPLLFVEQPADGHQVLLLFRLAKVRKIHGNRGIVTPALYWCYRNLCNLSGWWRRPNRRQFDWQRLR